MKRGFPVFFTDFSVIYEEEQNIYMDKDSLFLLH